MLICRDRDKYVSGDYRFRNGYSKSNPRKMVKMWAEKEYRNLCRMSQARRVQLFLFVTYACCMTVEMKAGVEF